MSPRASLLLPAILTLLGSSTALAQLDAWAEGLDDADDGATRDFYNRGASLAWQQQMGDWRDRSGALHGDDAWATTSVVDDDTERFVDIDVTDLVLAQQAGTARDLGFLLRATGSGGPIVFSSRESADAARRPQLVVTTASGSTTLAAIADTHLARSTFQQSGQAEELRVGQDNTLLLRFDRAGVSGVTAATLRVFTTRQFGGGLDIGVFAVETGVASAPAPEMGIAAAFDRDQGLASHADVLLFEGYEDADWMDHWTTLGGDFEVIDADPAYGFEALGGRALRVRLPEGENTALNTRYDFMAETGAEPDEIYFRYYLRFGDDWDQSVDGGKLPGISGTYGVAGWGGRRSDGTNGWSARGLYRETVPSANNPLGGRTPIGSYVYHADMPSTFGENFLWNEAWGADGRGGILERGRWVCLETYVRMNTPGSPDGVIRAWVDGVLSYETTDIRFRTVDTLHIERIWMNIYHGGTAVSPYDQHSFIDHVVVARSYIGPMGGFTPPTPDAGGPTLDAGVMADAGSGDVDAGSSDADAAAPAADGGSEPPPSDGCACRVGAARAPTAHSGWAPLLAVVFVARRRRRATLHS